MISPQDAARSLLVVIDPPIVLHELLFRHLVLDTSLHRGLTHLETLLEAWVVKICLQLDERERQDL